MRVFAMCVVIAAGCSGSDGHSRPSVNATQDNVCSELAQVACFNMYSCCTEGEIERRLGVTDPRTEDECIVDVERLCERSFARIDFSLKNNRVRFEAAAMNSCLAAIQAPADTCATVSAMLPWAAACMNSAWVGITANGDACDFAYECGTDSTCAPSGSCAVKPGNGQPCGAGCASGLFCSLGMCAPQLAAGQNCTATAQCMKDLFCDTSIPVAVCAAQRGIGEACTGNASCASNKCNPGTCAGTGGTCFTSGQCFAHCSNNGASCFVGQDSICGLGTCTTGGACAETTVCPNGGTCVFPNHCLAASCDGNIACDDNEFTVDYCQGALAALPVPPT